MNQEEISGHRVIERGCSVYMVAVQHRVARVACDLGTVVHGQVNLIMLFLSPVKDKETFPKALHVLDGQDAITRTAGRNCTQTLVVYGVRV